MPVRAFMDIAEESSILNPDAALPENARRLAADVSTSRSSTASSAATASAATTRCAPAAAAHGRAAQLRQICAAFYRELTRS